MATTVSGATVATTNAWLRVRHLSPVMFAAATLAFVLPFATASCSEGEGGPRQVTSFTGIQLATYSVPLPHVEASKGGSTAGESPDPDVPAFVESAASPFALLALMAVAAGVVVGLVELAGVPAAAASRISLAAGAVALTAMAYLAIRAIDAGPLVELHIGLPLISMFTVAAVLAQLIVWRARGGHVHDLLADGFAAGTFIALVWTFSIWTLGYLLEIEPISVPLFGTIGLFITGVGVGALAGAVAPNRGRDRLLLAAAGPVLIVLLSRSPLALPALAVLAIACVRIVQRARTAMPQAGWTRATDRPN